MGDDNDHGLDTNVPKITPPVNTSNNEDSTSKWKRSKIRSNPNSNMNSRCNRQRNLYCYWYHILIILCVVICVSSLLITFYPRHRRYYYPYDYYLNTYQPRILNALSSKNDIKLTESYSDLNIYDDIAPVTFGSCTKQGKSSSIWQSIADTQTKQFLLLGDFIYVRKTDIETYKSALIKAHNFKQFKQLTSVLEEIYAIYDDHDFGINDGTAKNFSQRRRDLFLQYFIDFQGSKFKSYPIDSKGLYHSFTLKGKTLSNKKETSNQKSETSLANFIVLDIRTFKEEPGYKTYGSNARIGSLYNGFGRLITSLRRTNNFKSDFGILGEKQWIWVTKELQEMSKTDLPLFICTSIQFFATNPLKESWMEYPKEKHRLLQLLATYEPKDVMFLSGDVHFAEFLTDNSHSTSKKQVLEVTSSGLTHSVGDVTIWRYLVSVIEKYLNSSRYSKDSVYYGRNFGLIRFGENGYVIEIKDNQGKTKLSTIRRYQNKSQARSHELELFGYEHISDNEIHTVVIIPPAIWFLLGFCSSVLVISVIWCIVYTVKNIIRSRKNKYRQT